MASKVSDMSEQEQISEAIQKALHSLSAIGRDIVLKSEQRTAIEHLLLGRDVIAILPTGFGKSMIFTVFALAKQMMKKSSSVLVVSPLKSIIKDQIASLESFNCTAVELSDETFADVVRSPPQFVYCIAEKAIEAKFLDAIKSTNSVLHQSITAVVVDESHTVETWAGQRKNTRSSKSQVFRSAYGKLAMLRSVCKPGTPFLALTGTADETTEKEIAISLNMRNHQRLFVSPNRTNLQFAVKKVPKANMLSQLDWIVNLVKENGINTPKVIIFCTTLYAISSVFNYLMMQLSHNAFYPTTSQGRNHCLLGIFHSATLPKYKDKLLQCFKEANGSIRVTVATMALSMGVNFPSIRYVVMWGPPRSILDFHQQAGRAGRDNLPSDVVLYYYGQQIVHCDDAMRSFLKCDGCYRKASYASLDPNVLSMIPAHSCCQFCANSCDCCYGSCEQPIKPFQIESAGEEGHHSCRIVSESDKHEMQSALEELQSTLTKNPHKSAFGSTSSHGFSSELIADVVKNSHRIFSIEDILTYTPVFNLHHAIQIFEIFAEMFDESLLTNPVHNLENMEFNYICLEELLNSEYDSSNTDQDID